MATILEVEFGGTGTNTSTGAGSVVLSGSPVFTGNIGINTVIPAAVALHVAGAGYFQRNVASAGGGFIAAWNDNTTDGNASNLQFLSNTTGTGAATGQEFAKILGVFTVHDHPTRAGAIAFYTANSGAPTEKVRINAVGSISIGTTTAAAGVNLYMLKTITGATNSYGSLTASTIQSDVTSTANGFATSLATQATSFTLSNLNHFNAIQSTIGAGSSVSNQTGYNVASSLTGASNNYGFRGQIPAGTSRWNVYMDGTAQNYMAGNLGLGVAVALAPLHVQNTAAQVRIGYDASNFMNVTVASTGSTSFVLTGTTPTFTFSQLVTFTANIQVGPVAGVIYCGGASTTTDLQIGINNPNTVASGTTRRFIIACSYNQTTATTANYDLIINRTETAIGSGTQRLISAQVSSVEKFGVDNNGNVGIAGVSPTTALEVGTFNTTNSNIKTGSIEIQPHSLNNGWIGENVFFSTSFKARATGAAGLFYFLGAEGQFRFATSVAAGSALSLATAQFKVNANNTVALGGSITTGAGVLTGATLVANSNGVSIGSGAVPAASAILDVTSTTKGHLGPRMTTAQKNAIASPAEALEVYDLDQHRPNFYNGTSWSPVAQTRIVLVDNSGTITHTGVGSETVIWTGTIPANSIGVNGSFHITSLITAANNANAKTVRVKFNGTNIAAYALTVSQASMSYYTIIRNRNSLTTQVSGANNSNSNGTFNSGTTQAVAVTNFNTGADITVTLSVNAVVGDVVTIEGIEFIANF
jgi:hypothetical protein